VDSLSRYRLPAVFLAGLLVAAPVRVQAADFDAAEQARAAAVEAQAPLMAPLSFEDGDKSLARARTDAERGRDTARIGRSLDAAKASFAEARRVARESAPILGPVVAARSDALEAGADGLELDDWSAAESELRRAAIAPEKGSVETGARRSSEAADRYRAAELYAIKLLLLSDARARVEDARRQKVHRLAPRTLARAEALIAEAEAAIESDRYDRDKPRELLREAGYEVRHAFQLARQIDAWRREGKTPEDLILEQEEPLRRAAASADIVARFDEGPDRPADDLVDHLTGLEDENDRLRRELEERTGQVFALEQEVSEAYDRLGGVAEQREALERKLQRQEMDRRRLADVEGLFGRDEARILRQGDDVILRLFGLAFPSGGADIPEKSDDLMRRVETAIRMFPGATLTVTGHTDSFGGDQANFELSRRRAEAVRDRLKETLRIPATRISAVGFGETQPVASNQTREGRARNRRIDIIIAPSAD
jgi:outer membrane protein OmpA-like peptidoglycan-associated protein